MKEFFIESVASLPVEIATFLLAMIPIGEVRLSIPVAIAKYEMSPISAALWSLMGNVTAGILVILLVMPTIYFLIRHVSWIRRFWESYIHRIETNNRETFEKWGSIALIIFVAIPLPMTGIFTGAVASAIFQVPLRRAFPLLLLGSMIASSIVTVITLITINTITT